MGGSSRARLLALAVAAPVAGLAALDLLLRLLQWTPPDDPLLFFARTQQAVIQPFVASGDGGVEIRADWVNDGVGLRGRRAKRPGRQFLLPGFRPARLETPKPAGKLRVFALGESTTYGLYVGAHDAFAAALEAGLRGRVAGGDVEVINLGCPGFASDRVAALLPSVLELEPDLVIVLVGHNEMLGGEVGPASELSPALRLRARLLQASTLFAWWNHVLAGTLRRVETEQVQEEAAALALGQIPTYVPQEVPAFARVAPSAPFRERAAERYAANLEAIIARAGKAGVPLLFAVPAANLRSPPGVSVHAQGFAAQVGFDAALRAGQGLLASGAAEDALERFDKAVALSPEHAGAHYGRGEALRALGRLEEARAAYQRAVDLDAQTHRITTLLEETLVATLRARDVAWVDLRPLFHERLDDEAIEALFVDHVHPTAEGHARIARALLDPSARLLRLP